ncbi:MAG: cyclic nucleotide-binding/CBS domain-containing protein [Candidatus Hodarchaeota archaeon]
MSESKGVKVGDLMHENLVSVESNALVIEAINAMINHEIGSVIVTRYGIPVGIVTEHDCHQKVCGKLDCSCRTISVEEIMATPLITIDSNASLFNAAQLMHDHNIRHLLVSRNGRIVGIITQTDILTKINELFLDLASYLTSSKLKDYSSQAPPQPKWATAESF